MKYAKKYPLIVKWGRYLGSMDYWTQKQLNQAHKDGAAANAIYKDSDSGEWVTAGGITNMEVRKALGLKEPKR